MQLRSVYNFTFLKTFITSYHTALPTAIDIDIFFMCGKGVGWESPLVTLSITTTILQNKEAILVTRMAGSV